MVINIDVATAVKNFLLNYAEIHGLPSPVRNVNRVTLSIIFLPAEMSYRSVHRDFLAGLEDNSKLRNLKYDTFRKLWHQLTPRTDLCQHLRMTYSSKFVKRKRPKIHKGHLAKAKLCREKSL